MYPIGFLFGLGFDTATEVALLVLAGSAVAGGLPFWAILSLPILFAAGMSLLDTIDGSFMNFAYGWAFSKPVRKVYYNITITGLSVAVALFIGGLEVAQVFAGQLNLTGGFWDLRRQLQHQPGRLRHRRASSSSSGRPRWRSGGSAGSRSAGSWRPIGLPVSVSGHEHATGRATQGEWDRLLRARGLRVTAARVGVLDALAVAGHSSPEDVHRVVGGTMNLSTVYRTLESLADAGLVAHTHLAGHQTSWSLASTAGHAHLVCRRCERVVELDPAATTALRDAALARHGFAVEVNHLSVFGLCRECAPPS